MARRYLGKGSHLLQGLTVSLKNATTAGALNPYGMNFITGSTGTPAYTLAGSAVIGEIVGISATLATSSKQTTVTLGSGVSFRSSNSTLATIRKATFADAGDTLLLYAHTTAKYTVLVNTGSVTLGTT